MLKYLVPTNAENFPEHAAGCKTGSTPKLGAVIVWKKGGTLSGSDGAGHVAIVEKINSDGSILISESGWNSSPFWTETVRKGDGNWRCSWMGSAYTFRCFIYNPAVSDGDNVITPSSSSSSSALRRGDSGSAVKTLQSNLNKCGYSLTVDGSFGPATETVVKDFQKKHNLTADGIAGPKTQAAIKSAMSSSSSNPTIKKGSSNSSAVKKLQTALNKFGYKLGVDGGFGAKTEAAVKDFQKKKGLTVDGIVGPKTWAALGC